MKKKIFLLPLLSLILAGCGGVTAPTSISVSLDKATIGVGEKTAINYTITPYTAAKDVYFTTSDEAIAIIQGSNVVGVRAGITTVNVYSNYLNSGKKVVGSTYVEVIEVNNDPTSIGIVSSEGNSLYVGGTTTLSVDVLPKGANAEVTWQSSDPAVMSVNNGLVTALSIGESIITAKSVVNEAIKGTINLRVLPIPEPISMNFEDIDLSSSTQFGTHKLTTGDLLGIMEPKSDGMVNNVVYVNAAYAGNGSSGAPYSGVHGLLKFGAKTEGPGSMHFTTKAKVSKIEMLVADWGDQDGRKQEFTDVVVNGETKLAPYKQHETTNSEGVVFLTAYPEDCKQWMTFEFDEPTDTIEIDSRLGAGNTSGVARFRLFEIKLTF